MDILTQIITYGNSKVILSGLIERAFNLATLQSGNYSVYERDGQMIPVNNIDNYRGQSFWILRTLSVVAEDDDLKGGGELYTHTFNFDLIVSKRKNELACDSFGTDFEIYQRILKALVENGSDEALRLVTTSRQATMRIKGYDQKPTNITQKIDYATISIKIEVILKANINCINNICANN
jgi:hypothetical protein